MSDDTSIRPLERADLPALAALIDATGLFPGALLDDMATPYLDPADDLAEFWLVAGGERPIGVLYCAPERMTQGTWNALLIAVHPDAQGSGVGTALVAATEARLRDAGARLVIVETSALPEFDRTRAFYHARGYREEARIRDFYQAGEGKVVFCKRLDA